MFSASGLMVLIMETIELTRAGQRHAAEKDARNECRVDDCDRPQETRHVCRKHYQQFRAIFKSKTGKDRLEFETEQIKSGRIGASEPGRAKDHVNAFAETN